MKQIISIIVIVGALAGAGIFGYLAFSKSSSDQELSIPVSTTSQILPMGSALNFDSVQKFNKNNSLFPYPVVNPSEIGSTTGEMIK